MFRRITLTLLILCFVVILTASSWQVDNVLRWLPLVERAQEYYPLDKALVLAVIGQESQGYSQLISCDGSIGLMQVIPGTHAPAPKDVRPYPHGPIWWKCAQDITTYATGGRPSWQSLLSPALNIEIGMHILHYAIQLADGDVWKGLAYYNCGKESYDAGRCYSYGGDAYAKKVMYNWLPDIRIALGQNIDICNNGYCIQ